MDNCKQRALESVARGDLIGAVVTMVSGHKDQVAENPFPAVRANMAAMDGDADGVRRFIEWW